MTSAALAQTPQPLPQTGDPAPVVPKGLMVQYWNSSAGLGAGCPAPPGSVMTPTSTTATLIATQLEGPIDSAVVTPGRPAGVNDDNIYARFTGFITTGVAGSYDISIKIDDGGRLWFNQSPLTTTPNINQWITQPPTTYNATFAGLAATTRYPVTFEWFEGGVTQYAGLLWTPPGGASAAIPLANLTPPDGPAAPTLAANAPTQPPPAVVNLSWNATAPAVGGGYIISRQTVSGAPAVPMQVLALINSGTTTTYADNTVAFGVTYSYIIQATSNSMICVGPPSTTQTVTPQLPAVIAFPTSGLQTNENGASTTFTIQYTQPAPVGGSVLTVTSSNVNEGVVSANGLVTTPVAGGFTYTVPQGQQPTITVTITGVDDALVDGPILFQVNISATGFAGPGTPPVTCTNNDNDVQGITFSRTSGLRTTENGGQDFFDVTLNRQPFNNVSFTLTSSNTAEGTVVPGSLTFTNATGAAYNAATGVGGWNVAHTVTVTGVDDTVLDFTVPYTIVSGTLTFADPKDQNAFTAAGVTSAPNVACINLDNEVPPALPHVWGNGCGLLGGEIALPWLLALFLRRRHRKI